MPAMNENELKVFIDAVTHYFGHITREPALIRASYLTDGQIPYREYTGLITVSGRFRGCVYFSAPDSLVRELLIVLGEPDRGEANVLDCVGEIANTIAGNARQFFGNALEISVPVTIRGVSDQIKAAIRARPFVIQIRWRAHEAAIVVDLEPA
jgi:chemotaxis protein CheX